MHRPHNRLSFPATLHANPPSYESIHSGPTNSQNGTCSPFLFLRFVSKALSTLCIISYFLLRLVNKIIAVAQPKERDTPFDHSPSPPNCTSKATRNMNQNPNISYNPQFPNQPKPTLKQPNVPEKPHNCHQEQRPRLPTHPSPLRHAQHTIHRPSKSYPRIIKRVIHARHKRRRRSDFVANSLGNLLQHLDLSTQPFNLCIVLRLQLFHHRSAVLAPRVGRCGSVLCHPSGRCAAAIWIAEEMRSRVALVEMRAVTVT